LVLVILVRAWLSARSVMATRDELQQSIRARTLMIARAAIRWACCASRAWVNAPKRSLVSHGSRIEGVSRLIGYGGITVSSTSTVRILAAWILIAGCAKGADMAADADAVTVPNFMQTGGTGGMGGMGGMAGMTGGMGGTGGVPVFDGEACAQGTTMPCACEGASAMGERICIANAASPTGGELSECRNCPAVDPDGGAAMGGASGMMSGGMGGATGGAGGTGGMTGGTGGMSGMTGGTGGMTGCMCMDALACCRDDGTCGVGVPGLCF
jgi:hypothetical protein